MSREVDNTPYWAVDPYKWDISFLNMHSTHADVFFDIDKEATVRHLQTAIANRGNRIYIGFQQYDSRDARYAQNDILQLAQFGSNLIHTSVWFGEHVTTMAVGDCGVVMTQSPLNQAKWELIQLPFTDTALAFRIGVDIALKCNKECIKYSDHRWTVFGRVLSKLFIPGYTEPQNSHDYDPDKPETWKWGVHCSQLTLLFLKRCALRNALHVPQIHRQRLMATNSYTCLPVDLRQLIQTIWGAVGEFRDYRHVGNDVRKVWYREYHGLENTRPLK